MQKLAKQACFKVLQKKIITMPVAFNEESKNGPGFENRTTAAEIPV